MTTPAPTLGIDMRLKSAILCCACTAYGPSFATAQQPASANPADPQAAVPAVRHESAFASYRPMRDEKPAPWREVNDEVGRVGGHLGIFRHNGTGTAGGHAGHATGAKK